MRTDGRIGAWAAAGNAELAWVPFHASWQSRIEAQLAAVHCLALNGIDHASRRMQGT